MNAIVAPHCLARLPYAADALEPVISARTLEHHHGRHHAAYVDTLNELVSGTALAEMSLQETVTASASQTHLRKIFNNSSQAWNHDFYWRSLRPGGGGKPPAALRPLLDASFGSTEACIDRLASAASEHFASGWVWLVQDRARLLVVHTANADAPTGLGRNPLLAVDLWEHAYYLDYQERRAVHVQAVLDKLINWGFAADNLV